MLNDSSNEEEDLSGINSSFNINMKYNCEAINNNTYVSTNIYKTSGNIKKNNSSVLITIFQFFWYILCKIKYLWKELRGLNGQKEVFPNDKKVMELIWKHLNLQDKKNCSLVCRRFNTIISENNYFKITKKLTSKYQIIPKLSRKYSTAHFEDYHCNKLKPLMNQMIDHFEHSLKNFTLNNCQFEMMTLNKILHKLPLLESLQLNLTLKTNKEVELPVGGEPKLVHLEKLIIKVNNEMLEEMLVMLSSALNIKSISLFDAKFGIDMIDYLAQYRKLTSLSLTKCIMEKPSFRYNLSDLDFDSSVKLPSVNYHSFDCLENLCKLKLINVNNELLRILKSNCVQKITDCKIVYSYEQDFDVKYFFQNLISDKELYEFVKIRQDKYKKVKKKPKPYCAYLMGSVLIKGSSLRGKMKIEYNFTIKNHDENSRMLYFKVSPIIQYEGSKYEYYERSDIGLLMLSWLYVFKGKT